MSLELYEAPFSPYCRSVKLIARLLKIHLELKIVNLIEKEQYKSEYLEKNPLRLVPTLNDNGFYLSESYAIAAYLVDKYSPDNALYPKDVQKRAVIDQMLFFDSGTLSPALAVVRSIIYDKKIPEVQVLEKAKEVLKTLDLILSKRKYVAGDSLTIADICLRATLTLNELLNYIDISDLHYVTTWAQKIREETSPDYGEINDRVLAEFSKFLKDEVAKFQSEGVLEVRH